MASIYEATYAYMHDDPVVMLMCTLRVEKLIFCSPELEPFNEDNVVNEARSFRSHALTVNELK